MANKKTRVKKLEDKNISKDHTVYAPAFDDEGHIKKIVNGETVALLTPEEHRKEVESYKNDKDYIDIGVEFIKGYQ